MRSAKVQKYNPHHGSTRVESHVLHGFVHYTQPNWYKTMSGIIEKINIAHAADCPTSHSHVICNNGGIFSFHMPVVVDLRVAHTLP